MNVRENIRENVQVQDSKPFGIAALVQAIPLPVTIFVIILVSLFIAGAAGFHAGSIQAFIDAALDWLKIGFIVVVVLVCVKAGVKFAMGIYRHYHEVRTTSIEREASSLKLENLRLKNRQLQAKVRLEEQLPAVIKYAIDAGHNIKYAGVEVTNVFSNVHTLGAGPAGVNPQNLLAGPMSAPLARPSLARLVEAVEYNSFDIALGANVTTGQPIVTTIIDCHLKIIGASGQGKSSLVASLLDQFRQTHDKQHLQIAILDLEDKTGRLFAGDEHVRMHARNQADVARALLALADFMEKRYQLTSRYGEAWLDDQPHILIYFEEFIDWKRNLPKFVDKETCELALNAFTTLSTRGRKANMHLMVCTQVNYADQELTEAFAQFVGINVCLGLKVQAALAAGFIETDLIKENYAAKTPGRFVVEKQGGAETGIAADYDARARLKELPGRAESRMLAGTIVEEVPDLSEFKKDCQGQSAGPAPAQDGQLDQEEDQEQEEEEASNISQFPISQPAARGPVPTLNDAILVWNEAIEAGEQPSRNIMRTRLQAKGFDCGENKARRLLEEIREQVEKRA